MQKMPSKRVPINDTAQVLREIKRKNEKCGFRENMDDCTSSLKIVKRRELRQLMLCDDRYDRLDMDRTPAVACRHRSLLLRLRGLLCRLGAATEHNTTGEDSRFATIVRRYLGLGDVNIDTGLPSALSA